MLDLETLDFSKGGGFVSVVCQDAQTRTVLMVARADREAMEQTISTGEMHYHSRTRGLWHKGAVSGNVQRVVSLTADCDGDVVLALVKPAGPACHTGAVSCFGQAAARGGGGPPPIEESRGWTADIPHRSSAARTEMAASDVLDRLAATISVRAAALHVPPAGTPSYTQRLLGDRNLRLKKLGEEASELVVACADADSARAAGEGADLIYHALVALSAVGVSLDDVRNVLRSRERQAPS